MLVWSLGWVVRRQKEANEQLEAEIHHLTIECEAWGQGLAEVGNKEDEEKQ